ncbi:hypothetical protein [Sphingomonas sp. Leaf25]|uniref:hypothetical protein n=1 Tax=Sphingomonas sp. Leaf25 TaxID=1735692 RepID=UPI0006FC7D47|nr:hypothetical protein [Sphingomonas sp. Leaf25]KQM97988.1 hypothetical protein ASE78_06865 [Sphingomonas sp. Leaf25]
MSKSFGLTIWALGAHHVLPISASEADDLVSAMSDLKHLVAFEQKFDLLLENLLELERELLDRALVTNLRGFQSAHDMLDDQLAFARRLLNLMSAARTYVDHVKHHMSAMHPGDAVVKAAVDALFADRYDASLDYRVMEAMRNYSQHRGMPVHGFSYEPHWIDEGGDRRLEANYRIKLDLALLREDKKFKASVLKELDEAGVEPDLKSIVRGYVAQLGEVHLSLRDLIDHRMKAARNRLSEWRERYSQASGAASMLGLAVVDGTDPVRPKHLTGLADTPLGYLDRLRRRNGSIQNISVRTVSSKVLPPKRRKAPSP